MQRDRNAMLAILEMPLQVPAWSFALVVVVVALISVIAALLALRSNRRGSHM